VRRLVLYIAAFLWLSVTAWADTRCAYPSLEGLSGDALWQAVHNLCVDHTMLDYGQVRADKANVDIVNGYVVDMYSGCSFYASNYCRDVEDHDDCECHNREHVLPKSWWGGSTTERMYTDLHHIIPADSKANTNRSNMPYGELSGASTWTNGVSKIGTSTTYGSKITVFEPQDEYKGDIARIYFYMLTCYWDKNFSQTKGATVFSYSGQRAGLEINALSLLLKWHRMDSVSSREQDRNNRVESKQHNRNPFVDEPDLVEYIWGNKKGQPFRCNGGGGGGQGKIIPLDNTQPMYNLLGMQVDSTYQGVVLQGGRKYLRMKE